MAASFSFTQKSPTSIAGRVVAPVRKKLKLIEKPEQAMVATPAGAGNKPAPSAPLVRPACVMPAAAKARFSLPSPDACHSLDEKTSLIAREGDSLETLVCDMPRAVFNGSNPAVPPGSHYEPWVWNALDKEGRITVELYVDGSHAVSPEMLSALGALRPRQEWLASLRQPKHNPVFDASLHCLMSIPMPDVYDRYPWHIASRVLLVPMTYQQVVVADVGNRYGYKRRASALASGKHDPTPLRYWHAHPAGIRDWLACGFDQRVIFGHCAISDRPEYVGEHLWWVVLSRDDVTRIHRSEGYPDALDVHDIEPRHSRYLGTWTDTAACQALLAAYEARGAVMPSDWADEDMAFVAASHRTRQKG